MNSQTELLFDLIESYADVNIFLDRDDFKATKAGLIISSDAVGHFPKKKGDKYTLWFGRGVERFTFKTFRETVTQVIQMMQSATVPINYRLEGREVKRFNRVFAKIDVEEKKKPVLRELGK